MPNYATKKELEDATGVDTSNLSAKRDFIALKAEVVKLDINKLVNFPSVLNNLQTKVDDSDVDNLKSSCEICEKDDVQQTEYKSK